MCSGVDWTEPQTWGCNGRHPPGGESAYDGTTLHPLEVMFTEVTKFKLYSGLTSARAAKRFDLWQHAQARFAGQLHPYPHVLLGKLPSAWTSGSTPRRALLDSPTAPSVFGCSPAKPDRALQCSGFRINL